MTPKSVPNAKSKREKSKSDKSNAAELPQFLSAGQLGNILDGISDGFVVFDIQMNYTYVNKKAGELLGQDPQDLIGKNYLDACPETKDSPFVDACTRALETETPIILEDYYRSREHWFEYRIHPSKDGLAIFFSEITQRRQAEQTLLKFRNLIDETNDAIYMIDEETGRYLNFNLSACKHLGYTRQELLQLTVMDVAQHLPTIEVWRERVKQVHNREQLLLESIYRRKNGSLFPVEISARMRILEDKPILLAVVRDITERKQSEASRQKHLDYLAALQKITIELLDRNDVKSLLETICNKAASLLDAKHGFIFLDDGDFLLFRATTPSLIHHIDEREKKPGTGVLGQVWQTGEPVKVEYYDTWELRDPNYSGDRLRAVAGVPILRSNSMVGVLVVARVEGDNHIFTDDEMDILSHFAELASLVLDNVSLYESALNEIAEREKIEDALKKSEERYRVLFEESPITIWEEDFSEAKKHLDLLQEQGVTDIHSYLSANPDEVSRIASMVKVVDVNKSALKMYRTKNKEEIYGNLQRTLLPETILSFKEELIAIAENRRYFTTESKDQVAGGEIIDISISWTVDSSIENYTRVIVSLIDITDRKRAEKIINEYAIEMERRVEERTSELVHLNKELEYANRAKSEFLANMSHELRTPLNSILGFSETLLEKKRGSLTEKQEQYISLIYSSGEHLLSLINDVLEVSKIEAGKLDVHPDFISIKEVCESSLNFVKTSAMRKSVSVEYINKQHISTVHADPQRLKQILVNLLNNAVKFTPEKGKVSLEVYANTERDQILFSVIDNGIGIAHEDLKTLFTPFTQIDSSLSRQYEGTGLGLVIVYKLTELHGGSVMVESEPGKGSRFTIILPWSEHDNSDQKKNAKVSIPTETTEHRSILKSSDQGIILLVEDNMANVLTVQEYLVDQGYEVVVAHNGVEAIARAEETSPRIILMDIQMPQMDGLEAIHRLRAMPKFASVPIIALTALTMPGDRERCLETGANEYMSKPVSLKVLVQTINELLRQKQ